MRCEDVGMLLNQYIDAELTDDLENVVSRHLLRCQTCAHEAHGLEQSRALLRAAVDKAEPTPAFVDRTASRLREKLAGHIRPVHQTVGRQWTLPFPVEDKATGTER
jgi:anti-sigma factor RsiW